MSVWNFLRGDQNRKAPKIIGAALATLVRAGWTVHQDRRTQRQFRALPPRSRNSRQPDVTSCEAWNARNG